MRRMRNVESDAAHFRSALVDQEDRVPALHEIKRIDAAHDEKSRDPAGAAARARLEGALARRSQRVLLAHFFDRPGLEDRIGEIANAQSDLPAKAVGNLRVIFRI